MTITRRHNKRNDLSGGSVRDHADPSTAHTVTLSYDRNGNLTSGGEEYTYEFNPWGQLVRIRDYNTAKLLAEFTYSGLGHRISERTDTSDAVDSGKPDGLVDGSDTDHASFSCERQGQAQTERRSSGVSLCHASAPASSRC